MLGALRDALGNLIRDGIDKVSDFARDMVSAGENLVKGIAEGVGNAAQSVLNAIGGVVNDAIGWAKSLLGIASPSKVFKSIGGYVSEGFANGIASKADEAVATMKALADDVVDAAKTNIPAIEVPVGLDLSELTRSGVGNLMGGFSLQTALASAGGANAAVTNNYYTIEKVDLSGDLVATKAASTLWNGVRRQIRMGAM